MVVFVSSGVALAKEALPANGLNVFVIDEVESRPFSGFARVVPDNSGYDYQVTFEANGTTWVHPANLSNLGRAITLLRGLFVSVEKPDGQFRAALPINIVIRFEKGIPNVLLALQYYSGDAGFEHVPVEDCVSIVDGPYPAADRGDLPDWKPLQVHFNVPGKQGTADYLYSQGRAFFYEQGATTDVATAKLIYPSRTPGGWVENYTEYVDRRELLDAYMLFNFGQPLLVQHPVYKVLVLATPRQVVADLRGLSPKIWVEVAVLGSAERILVQPDAMKGIASATIFCPSVVTQYGL